jgi:hypothetical protein
MQFTLMSLDAGNSQIKCFTGDNKKTFMHALWQLTPSQVAALDENAEEAQHPQIFKVNGTWYAIAEKAVKMGFGSALLGELRYTPDYYGVLAAVTAYLVFDRNVRNIYLHGSHTAKDIIYRDDLINAVAGDWEVQQAGQERRVFTFKKVRGFEEPVGAFRHATLSDDGTSLRNQSVLGRSVGILDIGGYTFAVTTAEKYIVDYGSSRSEVVGILNVIDEFGTLVRNRYKKLLKGSNKLDPVRLRSALQTGIYDGRGLGDLPVREEREQAFSIIIPSISQFFEMYGGVSEFNAILLAGGGSVLMEKKLREVLKHPSIHLAEEDRGQMHLSTARGGYKVLRALAEKGKL